MRPSPTKLNLWCRDGSRHPWRYAGRLHLVQGDRILALPVSVEQGEVLAEITDYRWPPPSPHMSSARSWFGRFWIEHGDGRGGNVHAEEATGPLLPEDAQPGPLAPPDEEEEAALAKLRQKHGQKWVTENWVRLREEWAYIQSI
jgi:hypothetical protein